MKAMPLPTSLSTSGQASSCKASLTAEAIQEHESDDTAQFLQLITEQVDGRLPKSSFTSKIL
jgi:hypothetical protein